MIAFLRSKTGLVLLAFLAIAAFFVITEHQAHVYGALPYVLLLLVPVLHMFMHAGHGGHGGHGGQGGHGGREHDGHGGHSENDDKQRKHPGGGER